MNQTARILIVDDEAISRETLGEMLITQGYDLVYAADGKQALNQIDQFSPDLILLDIMMPGLNGFDVCRRLKDDARWRHVPVILVTALDSKSDLVHGLDSGADDFLTKPVNLLELRARVRSLLRIKQQYDEIQAAMGLREDMVHMIVHDMRVPLTAILGLSEIAQWDNVTLTELQEDMAMIHGNARRLNAFVNDILTLAKMREGRLTLNPTQINLRDQLSQALNSHRLSAKQKQIGLTLDIARLAADTVYLDAPLFQRVLDNLVSNAIKFAPPESTVTIRLEFPATPPTEAGAPPEGGAVISSTPLPKLRLQVIDEGSGIDPKYQDEIFEKFVVIKDRRKTDAQVGLGLAFCKMVVEAHGGRIYIESNQPKGSIFTVEI
jgi:signal transduction histidine kinase